MYTLRFDGLYRDLDHENQENMHCGLLCYGWVIYQFDRMIAKGHGACVQGWGASSNVAEYLALIEGLDALIDFGATNDPVKIFGDAKSIIDQMAGRSGVSSETIWPLYQKARGMSKRFTSVRWTWMPRKFNLIADELSHHALNNIFYVSRNMKNAIAAVRSTGVRNRPQNSIQTIIDLRIYQPAS